MVDVLVVGAHPDDIELGIGAAVARWAAAGYEVAMLDLTSGEPTPFGDPETRAKEAAEAARILGVKTRVTLDLPNRTLTDNPESRRKVAEVYRRLRPEMLFVQGEVDAHPDHIEGSSLSQKARFDAKLTKTDMAGEPWYAKKLFFYLASHLRLNVKPSFILDVTDTFEKKLEAVHAYKSQFAASGKEEWIIERLRARASYYGALIGVEYGEPVMCHEEIGLRDLRDIII